MDYRREIDGLRALAVVPVILFHAGFETFSGGFVGVDVFFVISGYLITTIILSELEQEKFSIVRFYERRARRILPALFLVLLACIPFAGVWLLPSEMKDFSRSLVAVSVFASNILFWRESGYFDAAAELKPLLHTWSLAVEEQYYVLFPLFLILLWRLGKRWILVSLAIVGIVSLTVAQWAAVAKPAAAFYLLPMRAWELAVGAFGAFYLSNSQRVEFSKGISEVGGWLGLALIFFSVFAYSRATPFPGFYAVLPTVGAVLIILFATKETTVGQLVGNRVLVGVGLISYSAYLWHQPMFAFARNRSAGEPSDLVFIVLSIGALVLAYFSWRYVEQPFRDKSRYSRREVFIASLVGSIGFIAFGLIGIADKGFALRFDDKQRALIAFSSYDFKDDYRNGDCFLSPEQSFKAFKSDCLATGGGGSVLIWGDSHAAALSFGLRSVFASVSQFTASGCPPLLDVAIRGRPMCAGINKFVSQEIAKAKPHAIFLHANWLLYDDQLTFVNLKKTIAFIQEKAPQTRIIIIGGVPQYKPSLPRYLLAKQVRLDDNVRVESYTYDAVAEFDEGLRSLSQKEGIGFFSPVSAFCTGKQCQVTTRYEGALMPTAWDYGHLTSGGSVFLSGKIKAYYDQVR